MIPSTSLSSCSILRASLALLSVTLVLAIGRQAHAAVRTPHKDTYGGYDVVVRNNRLYVEGKEFFIKGMAYSPAPLGLRSVLNEFGGGGLCSPKQTVFGEEKSACFGSDYFDGVIIPHRDPPGPFDSKLEPVPWWWNVWMRDLPRMKEIGVNTVRIYNLNPMTKHYLSSPKGRARFPDADPERGAQHLPFLDLCHRFGLKVMVPIVQDEAMLYNMGDDLLDELIESQIDEMGNHPAVIMYVLGNELGLFGRTDLRAVVNTKMTKVREYQFQRWDRTIPVTSAVIDLPHSYEILADDLQVEVFTSNAGYRAYDYRPLWEGGNTADFNFSGWTELSKQHQVPLLIGEIGMHDQPTHNRQHPDWFNQQWKQIVEHMDSGCIGAVFFEFTDEEGKGGDQAEMGAFSLAPFGGQDIGVSSLDPNVWAPDLLIEKSPVFESIKEGYPGSEFKKYNMNSDVWELVGRKRTQLSGFVPSNDPPPQPPPIPMPFPQTQYPPGASTGDDDGDPGTSTKPPGDDRPGGKYGSSAPMLSPGHLVPLLTVLLVWVLLAALSPSM